MTARSVRHELFLRAANGLSRADGFGARPLTVRRGLDNDVDDRIQKPHWDRAAGGRGFASRLEAHRRLNYLRFAMRRFRHQCAPSPVNAFLAWTIRASNDRALIPNSALDGALSLCLSLSLTSLSLSQRYRGLRGIESVGDCVAAIYVELALLTSVSVSISVSEVSRTWVNV